MTTKKNYKQRIGTQGEDLACDFLQKKGYAILERNFRFGKKEIDIIAQKDNTIIFVEVKAGYSKNFGEPQERVTKRKQKQIIDVALSYIQKNDLKETDFRFDVITIKKNKKETSLEHFESAFLVPD